MVFVRSHAIGVGFILLWGIYFAFLAFGGFTSTYPELAVAIRYQLVFVAAAGLPLLFVRIAPRAPDSAAASGGYKAMIVSGLVLSAFAIASLAVDAHR